MIAEDYKTICLTQGKTAFVSKKDYLGLCIYKWYAVKCGSKWYAAAWVRGRQVFMHRFLLGLLGEKKADHRNGDGLDNRRSNLREATALENNLNRKKKQGCTSDFKGISWNRQYKKWEAQISFKGKQRTLGRFIDEDDAAICFDVAAQLFHGEFAYLNNA